MNNASQAGEKLRILHLGKYFAPYSGGIENFLAELVQEQSKTGHQVHILAHWHKPGKRTSLEKLNNITLTRAAILGQFAFTPLSPTFPLHLKHILNTFRPHIVHVHLPNPSAFWILRSQATAPIFIHWHADALNPATGLLFKILYQLYRVGEKRLINAAARIIVTSQEYQLHSPALQTVTSKCRVIPLGLDPKRFVLSTNTTHRDKQNARLPLVLSLGRFTFYKGFDQLIKAARHVERARFVIIGDGPLRGPLKKMIKKFQLEDRFFLPGHLTDCEVSQYFKKACLFCLPSTSRAEAFGLVLLEAMLHGLPLVTSRVEGSGMNQVNIHGETGLWVPPANPRALAWAINRLLKDPELRASLGRQAKKRFYRFFHIKKISDMLTDVYLETTS